MSETKTTAIDKEHDSLWLPSMMTRRQILIWLNEQRCQGKPCFSAPFIWKIKGEIEPTRFSKAFDRVVASSDALRSTVQVTATQPQLKIQPISNDSSSSTFLDFSENVNPDQALSEWCELQSKVTFNLDEHLFECALVKLSKFEFAWYLNTHHLITDGRSTELIFELVAKEYQALGGLITENALAVPNYQSAVEKEREQRDAKKYLRGRHFWNKQITALPELSDYPWNNNTIGLAGSQHRVILDESTTSAIKKVQDIDTSNLDQFGFLCTPLIIWQHLLKNTNHVSLATTIENRTNPTEQASLGLFMLPLPLGIKVQGSDKISSVLARVKAALLSAMGNHHYTPIYIDPEKTPDTLFNYLTMGFDNFAGFDVSTQWLYPGHQDEALSLHVHDFDNTDQLTLEFHLRNDIFDTIQQKELINNYIHLLKACLESPETPLSDLALYRHENTKILHESINRTTRAWPETGSLFGRFRQQTTSTPHATALIWQEKAYTYQTLLNAVELLSQQLRNMEVKPGDKIGLLIPRSVESVVGILATIAMGAIYIPIDPELPAQNRQTMLTDCRPKLVLVTDVTSELLDNFDGQIIAVNNIPEQRYNNDISDGVHNPGTMESVGFCPDSPDPERTICILYTSGSTGTPKRCALSQGTILNRCFWGIETFGVDEQSVFCQKTTLNFVDSLWEIFGAVMVGAKAVILPQSVVREPARMIDHLARYKVGHLMLVPSLLSSLLEALEHDSVFLPELDLLSLGGEPLTATLLQRCRRILSNTRVLNVLGSSENLDTCWFDATHWSESATHVPVGRPLPNTKLYILDSQLRPLPAGIDGDLYIAGIGVNESFSNDIQESLCPFIDNPFEHGEYSRLFRSGDRACYLPSGDIEYKGRLDSQIKIRGYRVDPAEVESCLRSHRDIKNAVILREQDSTGSMRLRAFIVLDNTNVGVNLIRESLRLVLPLYKIPADITAVASIPMTTSGKVDRVALENDSSKTIFSKEHLSDWESKLFEIWTSLLGHDTFDLHTDFFSAGGHSLLALQLIYQIDKRYGRSMPMTWIFESPTIAQLAYRLETDNSSVDHTSIVPIQQNGTNPPLILLPTLRGSLLHYEPLGKYLENRRKVYGLLPTGLDGISAPLDTIPTLTDHYLAQLLKFQSKGPFLLGGESIGGIFALEVALRLKQAGHRDVHVMLFDTYAPGFLERQHNRLNPLRRLLNYVDQFRRLGYNLTARPTGTRIKFLKKVLAIEIKRVSSRMTNKHTPSIKNTGKKIADANFRAITGYVPTGYNVSTTLFLGKVRFLSHQKSSTLDWNTFIPDDQLSLISVEGYHGQLCREPYAANTANALNTRILELTIPSN